MSYAPPAPLSARKRLLYSVRLRLALWFVAILAVVLAGFSLFIYTRQIRVVRAEAGQRLVSEAARLQAVTRRRMERDHDDEAETQADLAPETRLLNEQDSLVLVGAEGEVLLAQGRLTPETLLGITGEWERQGQPGEPLPVRLEDAETSYLAVVTPLRGEHDRTALQVLAGPVDPNHQLPRLALSLAASSAALLLLALAGGFWLADQAMRPVQAITRTARQIGESDLRRRLHLDRPDELGELANTFDQMLDRLQAAFERQRRFTADASHELRTPLTIIELEVSRALEHPRSPQEYEQALRLVKAENDWMSSLVTQLLTLARLDAGQAARQRLPLDLSELVVEVIERLTPLAQQRGVTLLAGKLDEAPILGERAYLAQMLVNLVENAIKYAGTGMNGSDPYVRVEAGQETRQGQPGGRVEVSDNGPGIPAEHLPHLFERFYQVDPSRTREVDQSPESAALGSGLGLAIVQGIVQAHAGKIEVHSQVGAGTRFTVWIPGEGEAKGILPLG